MGLRSWLASLLQPARPGYSDSPSYRHEFAEAEPKLRYPSDTPEHYEITPPPPLPVRQADFRYLGADVSYRLGDAGVPQRVREAGLPALETPHDLCRNLGVLPARLKWLSYHAEVVESCHYVHYEIPKRDGTKRSISAPRPHTAACQRWILRNLLSLVPTHTAAHGFVTGRSITTGAGEHVGRQCVVHFDLKDFFPTITFPRVRGLFESFGYSPRIASILALLCTESPREKVTRKTGIVWQACGPRCLPQGACTSPAISNLVSRSLDRRLTGLARSLGGWQYTRYADDLTFSADKEASQQIGYLMHRVRGITNDERFQINESKTRVQRRSQRQLVTGLVVNDRVAVPRKTVRRLRSILHHARTEGLEAQNREGHDDFEGWLTGMIGHVTAADPQRGRAMMSELNEIRAKNVMG